MSQFEELTKLVDMVLIDNMQNDFIMKTGSWPEGYFFTDKNGSVTWKCTVVKGSSCKNFVDEAN